MKTMLLNLRIIIFLIPLCMAGCTIEFTNLTKITPEPLEKPLVDADFNDITMPETENGGWTQINRSVDSRIIYVSSTSGDDSNGITDPNEIDEDHPVATLARGVELVRDGYPDHLLLKKGDSWTEAFPSWNKRGRSAEEPVVISSYGSGPRPLISGPGRLSISGRGNVHQLRVIGLEFYCSYGDPDSVEFDADFSRGAGIGMTGSGGDILIEDCRVSYNTGGIVIQSYGEGRVTDIKIRRSIIEYAYSTNSHSQGLYTYEIDGLLIQECVFDHNGWLVQSSGNTQAGGGATMFNHNTYINQCNQVYVTGNLFLRPSSIGNKFNSNDSNESIEIVVDNNLYFDGEVGLSIGGNTEDEYRFGNVEIINNVFTRIGRSLPTTREFAWALDVIDNFNTTVSANLVFLQDEWRNSYGIHISGRTNSSLTVTDNVIYHVNGSAFIFRNYPVFRNILFAGNRIDNAGIPDFEQREFYCVRNEGGFANIQYSDNRYASVNPRPFLIAGEELEFTQWVEGAAETGAVYGGVDFTDSTRSLSSYYSSIGGSGDVEEYINQVKELSRDNWDSRLLAPAVNAYLRDGFDIIPKDSLLMEY